MKKYISIVILSLILISLVFVNTKILAGEGQSSIIINEIFFDPVGTDSPNEWIELYNPTDQTILIQNWKVMVAGSTFVQSTEFSAQIPSHEYFVICEKDVVGCDLYLPKIAMQNGGGATDALSITDGSGKVIDQVFYDIPNTNNLKDMFGNVVDSSASAVIGVSGESLGRSNFIDTNVSSEDFFVYSTPTPGTENKGDIVDEQLPQTGDTSFLWIVLLITIFSGILIIRVNLFKYIDVKIHKKGSN